MNHTTPRSGPRSAFTLIELLVVIAIIAILAAILFPVFAQARAAARGASSQSNIRQLSLGILMYTQDYDETYPEFQRWGSGPVLISGTPFSTWGYDILPYIKDNAIFADPQYGGIKGNQFFNPFYTHYGYNYTALAPTLGDTSPWVGRPASLASVSRPAELVMIAGRFTVEEAGGNLYWYGPGTMLDIAGAEAPDCADIAPVCWSDWAPDGYYSFLNTEETGKYTGGVSLRKAKNANFALTDGHVKFMQAGQAAVGTNWFKGTTSGNVHITDPTKYMWSTSP